VVAAGALYVVATPIGNLEDITLRALRILREASVIACEDTRVTRKLLSAHGIEGRVVSFHAHSKPEVAEKLIGRLLGGEDVALVSDAGTPLLSDPGDALVKAAIARGIVVVPVPGASALLATLAASGLPAERVLFLGFLPREDGDRREILGPLRDAPYTLVIYESPRRVREVLIALARSLGDRPACVARELTKRFETFERGRLSELADRFAEETLGEVTIAIGPAEAKAEARDVDAAAREARRLLGEGMRASEAAKVIAGAFGLARQEAYQLVLDAKSGGEE
jgi:16S rRNA (cytidine1402-2'-O)-methyltransferase